MGKPLKKRIGLLIFAVTIANVIIMGGCSPATPVATNPATSRAPAATVAPGTSTIPGATTGTTQPAATSSGNSNVPPSALPTTTPSVYTVDTNTKTGLVKYLIDANGMTLYYFTQDSPGKSTATGAVLNNWPPFYAARFIVPAPLKDSDFSTITRDDGTIVTAYKGWALYHYINDKTPGDTLGQGVNGQWFVVNPDNFPPQATGLGTTSASPATPPLPSTPTSGY